MSDFKSDSSATEAMVLAAIQAESRLHLTRPSSDWPSTLDDLLVHPSIPSQTAFDDSHQNSKILSGGRTSKSYKPTKTSPPPNAIRIDSSQLSDRIDSLQGKALIRKWYFPVLDDNQMRAWLEARWKPLIGYTPIIAKLLKEWFCFHFLSAENRDAILNLQWVCGRSFLSLHRWYLGFNPLSNTLSNNLIWLKLPGLPLDFWTPDTLSEIGNAVGRSVYVDPWCRAEKYKRVAWILIERSFRGGFPEHIDICWRDLSMRQRLDY